VQPSRIQTGAPIFTRINNTHSAAIPSSWWKGRIAIEKGARIRLGMRKLVVGPTICGERSSYANGRGGRIMGSWGACTRKVGGGELGVTKSRGLFYRLRLGSLNQRRRTTSDGPGS